MWGRGWWATGLREVPGRRLAGLGAPEPAGEQVGREVRGVEGEERHEKANILGVFL